MVLGAKYYPQLLFDRGVEESRQSDILYLMTDTLLFAGKTYTSSKRAAEESGYAQDYIGQLARKGLITAERVGNLWYVSMESLNAYKVNAESYVPEQPQSHVSSRDADSYISFDGKDYISASRGSKLTGYNPDYIGQLARGSKILSRQVGNRWYVERESLLAHKREKDALLAAVQAESVGLASREAAPAVSVPEASLSGTKGLEAPANHHFRYFRDNEALLPPLTPSVRPSPAHTLDLKKMPSAPAPVSTPSIARMPTIARTPQASRRAWHGALEAGVALTVVIVLSYGFISIKDGSLYALKDTFAMPQAASSALATSAEEVYERALDLLEELVVPELIYRRAE